MTVGFRPSRSLSRAQMTRHPEINYCQQWHVRTVSLQRSYTGVSQQVGCDHPAASGKVFKIISDGNESCANHGDLEVYQEEAQAETVMKIISISSLRKTFSRVLTLWKWPVASLQLSNGDRHRTLYASPLSLTMRTRILHQHRWWKAEAQETFD